MEVCLGQGPSGPPPHFPSKAWAALWAHALLSMRIRAEKREMENAWACCQLCWGNSQFRSTKLQQGSLHSPLSKSINTDQVTTETWEEGRAFKSASCKSACSFASFLLIVNLCSLEKNYKMGKDEEEIKAIHNSLAQGDPLLLVQYILFWSIFFKGEIRNIQFGTLFFTVNILCYHFLP